MPKAEEIALIIYICASSAGVLIIKNFLNSATNRSMQDFLYHIIDLNVLIGVLLYVTGFVSWLYVLSKINLNVIYPIATTATFLIILIMSVLILKEKVTVNVLVGTALCIIGIFVILRAEAGL